MLFHVFVLGGITTTDIAAAEAHSQGRPDISGGQAIVAYVCGRFSDFDKIQMTT
jgi:hypothetical protein